MRKVSSEIEKVVLNSATYHCEEFTPTLINFFFGNNGTGKTTIGSSIRDNSGIEWRTGRSAADYTIHVYNQEYITANIARYHNLESVFTVNEVNAEVVRTVENLTAQREVAETARGKALLSKQAKEKEQEERRKAFENACWQKTAREREVLEKTLDGHKQKRTFADGVLEVRTPTDHNEEQLVQAISMAYRSDSQVFPTFNTVENPECLDSIPGVDILSKQIVSSAGTDFARFVKALNATRWVREGHEKYHTDDGRCPYCQQALPDNFEDELRSCFDEQYEVSIQALSTFYEAYRNAANGMFVPLSRLPDVICPGIDVSPLKEKLSALKGIIATNVQLISEKKANPEILISIEPTAILLHEISDLIDAFNVIISTNNAIMAQKSDKQRECKKAAWELLAYRLRDTIDDFRKGQEALRKELTELTEEIDQQKKIAAECIRQISEENKKSVNTRAAVDGMNALLRDSGFQGFELRERSGVLNTYEVIRQDTQQPAINLSEGELNFIAFLYFYHQVKGTDSPDGITRDKIVVIDDPVSSMDSSALFIVAALIREMVNICRNNADGRDMDAQGRFIKQIFVLTHNSYFHREVSYSYVSRYEFVSFYLIRKIDNQSTITHCVRTDPNAPTRNINYSPVHSTYAALWEEYREVKSAVPLLNVIRRILEYYFLQLCGYEGSTLRQTILKDNRTRFVTVDDNGKEDCSQLHIASAMLSYISAAGNSISDGINYIDECVDVEQSRKTFALIFDLMNQDQHYKMMMGESQGGNQNAIQL